MLERKNNTTVSPESIRRLRLLVSELRLLVSELRLLVSELRLAGMDEKALLALCRDFYKEGEK